MSDDMPRIIREHLVDPFALCAALGLSKGAKRQQRGVLVRCPVHQDSTPSCSVTVGADGTVRWRCFACSASGDALTLVAVTHGLDVRNDFGRVLEVAAGIAGVRLEREPGRGEPMPTPRPQPAPTVQDPDAVDNETFAAVVAPLMRLGALDCRGNADVCGYLDGRGLLAVAREDGWFSIGPAAGEMLTSMFGSELVARCGLTDQSGALKWPQHTLAIPWRTRAGLVQTIQRRHLGDCDPKRRYVFPTGRGPAEPYGVDRLRTIGPIAIVEGAMDVLAWRASAPPTRYETPLGVPGVSGWKRDWDALAKGRIVSIAYDADEAGEREVTKLMNRFLDAGASRCRRVTPSAPGAKDWADGLKRSA